MNFAQLRDNLKGVSTTKARKQRKTLIQKFIDTLPTKEVEFHEETYCKIKTALEEERHVTNATLLLPRRNVFISENEVNLYFQIGCVIEGEMPITPSEYIRQLNQESPIEKKPKNIRFPGVMRRLTSVKLPHRRSHSSEEDSDYK